MIGQLQNSAPAGMVRGRFISHPGPLAGERRTSHEAASADQFRLWITPGSTLFEGLAASVIEHGFDHASIQLFDGELAEAYIHVPGPDPTNERAVAYGPAIRLEGGAHLVSANVTLGHSADGKPLLHCHAVLLDRQGGMHGGHLPTEICVVGEGGVFGWGIVSEDRGFVQKYDPETLFTLLFPTAAEDAAR